jgi:hypothetical protein
MSRRHRAKRLIATRLGCVLLAVGAVACEGPTGVGASDVRFDGDWIYVAEQAGTALTIEGTLRIDGAESGSLDGTLDAQQVSALGDRTPFPGLVAGVVTSTGMARLEISLPSGRRRTHLTQLRGDSLVGDWVESGASPASGTFRAARERR